MRKRKLQHMTTEQLKRRLSYLTKRQQKLPTAKHKTSVQVGYIKYQLRKRKTNGT